MVVSLRLTLPTREFLGAIAPSAHDRDILLEPNRTTALGNQVRARQRRRIHALREKNSLQM